MKKIGIGLVGYNFMGKAHSNAFLKVGKFFNLSAEPDMAMICGRTESKVKAVQENWGWKNYCTDYRDMLKRDDIDIIDISTPNNSHMEIALAAAESGKHIICEKPVAMNSNEAREMLEAVRKSGKKHMVWFNYRRVPALALAKRIIAEGKIGDIYHVRATYLQDWIIDPEFPLVWRLKKEIAGSGAHGDLNAHIIDMARFLVGEFDEVTGLEKTFIKERPDVAEEGSLSASAGEKTGEVTVDDAVLFLARFKNGAIGSFEATRFANGRKNGNRIEINGSKGSMVFYFERMNELEYFSSDDPDYLQGFKKILVTESCHPYIDAWWPPGHIIGYEHTFINQAYDLIQGIMNDLPLYPDFEDGLKCQQVLDAVVTSARERSWIKVDEM